MHCCIREHCVPHSFWGCLLSCNNGPKGFTWRSAVVCRTNVITMSSETKVREQVVHWQDDNRDGCDPAAAASVAIINQEQGDCMSRHQIQLQQQPP